MRRRELIALAPLLISIPFFACTQDVCRSTACRTPRVVTIHTDANRVFETRLPKAPFYSRGVASIAVGETLYLEANSSPSTAPTLSYTAANEDPSRTLVLSLSIEGEESGKPQTRLRISNPLARPFTYKASIRVAGTNGFQPISTCPVMARLSSYEHWPYPIVQIALSDFAFMSDAEARSRGCK